MAAKFQMPEFMWESNIRHFNAEQIVKRNCSILAIMSITASKWLDLCAKIKYWQGSIPWQVNQGSLLDHLRFWRRKEGLVDWSIKLPYDKFKIKIPLSFWVIFPKIETSCGRCQTQQHFQIVNIIETYRPFEEPLRGVIRKLLPWRQILMLDLIKNW